MTVVPATTFEPPTEQPHSRLFNREQPPPRYLHTIVGMYSTFANGAVVAAWVVGLGTIAWSTSLASSGGWTLLLAWGLFPPFLLIHLRKQQEKTISERIREALR